MFKHVIFSLLFLIILNSCKNNTSDTLIEPSLSSAYELANSEPTNENIQSYFSAVNDFVAQHSKERSKIVPALNQASKFAIDQKMNSRAIGFLMPILKGDSEDPDRAKNLLTLTRLMVESNKEHVAKVIYKAYRDSFPTAGVIGSYEKLIENDIPTSQAYVDTLFNTVFENPDEYGLNRANALKYVDVTEAFALANPHSSLTPAYLYKASEVARSIRTMPKALSIYDWILTDYENYEKYPTVMFLKGFVLENELNNSELAKTTYEEFLSKFPNHELASSVKFLIENLGKSDEEILKFIEEKGK